ncbi:MULTISPECIES: Crp/Fnr family transcriptional regulator [unclassified Phenylobacterium]|uniref:Crp/Fnr family transcriptional regulator n=1 Tax=unclassified Phenylobacterium TaxID=2640670 RepID=UPI000ABE83C9|nr:MULTISPECIES: Crp/Fnr family transcriptional regulator [unclassified Phenylobacterium]
MQAQSTQRWARNANHEVLAQAFAGLDGLGEEAVEILLGLKALAPAAAGQLILAEHDFSRPLIVVKGWAARVRWLSDGRRQIFDFLLPGDALGLGRGADHRSPVAVVAITAVHLVDAQPVRQAMQQQGPARVEFIDGLDEKARLDELRLLNQIQRLGRHSAYERICHLLLDLRERCGRSDPAPTVFEMPLTQECLSDVLGLSVVHVNRVLQQLRRDRLLEIRGGFAALNDLQALQDICEFYGPTKRELGSQIRVVNGPVWAGASRS